MVDQSPFNSVGLFRDADNLLEIAQNLGLFTRTQNPLYREIYSSIIFQGKDMFQWDNIHQTLLGVIDQPGLEWPITGFDIRRPGCPECLHSHWRWGTISWGEGDGRLLVPEGTNQDLDFAVVKFQPDEEDPHNLKISFKSLRRFALSMSPR